MSLENYIAEIDARNAKELKRLKWENSLLKKILEAGHPLTVDFADRRFDQTENKLWPTTTAKT